jgi:transcriptional regulator with XRE-family HTH domain
VQGVRPEDPARLKRNVGRRIAELRRRAGLSQDKFAEVLGNSSVKYVQRVERGVENLTLETMVKLVNALRARTADLFRTPRAARPAVPSERAAPARPRRARPAR